jgi:hypothetical protein
MPVIVTLAHQPEGRDAKQVEKSHMSTGECRESGRVQQQLPAGAHIRRRLAPGKPGNPDKEDQRQPARPFDDYGPDEIVGGVLQADDVDGVDDGYQHRNGREGVKEGAPGAPVRPEKCAAGPKSLPDKTFHRRPVPSCFLPGAGSGK